MGERVRGLMLLGIVLAAGVFIGSAISQWNPLPEQERTVAPPRNPTTNTNTMGRIRVEVLNAGGEAGMARVATDRLRDQGFDVVYFGNADAFDQDSTVVLDRSGRPEAARAVGEVMRAASILSEPDSNLYLDVTVLLGKEWAPEDLETENPPGDGAPWWDLRRHLR